MLIAPSSPPDHAPAHPLFPRQVVREVYVPEAGVWLSEYPFTNRELFLDISLDIERSRQAAAATQPPPPAGSMGPMTGSGQPSPPPAYSGGQW
jgi:hypothetical protein